MRADGVYTTHLNLTPKEGELTALPLFLNNHYQDQAWSDP
jgi:hypothetical protein